MKKLEIRNALVEVVSGKKSWRETIDILELDNYSTFEALMREHELPLPGDYVRLSNIDQCVDILLEED